MISTKTVDRKVLIRRRNIIYDHTTLDFSDCNFEIQSVCTKSNNSLSISIEKSDDTDILDMDLINIKINGKIVLENEMYYSNSFDILDDIVIFTTSGSDIRSTTLYAFDSNANEILNLRYLDDNYPTMIIADMKANIYNIEDNKIKLSGTRMTHGTSLVTEITNTLEKSVYICENKEKYINEIIEGDYEIEYLGNKKFSDIKNIEYVKLYDTNYIDECN